jgi:nicotinate-nucleotide adenylyltransferase
MTARRLGILGGTFDPIHNGHLDVGTAAAAALSLTEIQVLTSNIPPHRPQPVASSYHRFAMVALAVVGRPNWRASDVELAVGGAPSYTTATLQRFHEHGCAATELFFVIGTDAFADVESWKDYPGIFDRAHFVVVSRPGLPVSEMPARLPALASRMTDNPASMASNTPLIFLLHAVTTDVSATAIRRRCAARQSIARLVPPGVQQYIEQHDLYSSPLGTPSGGVALDAHRMPAAGRLHGQD